jgi:phage host-nuclease inhibitor protein Gam
LAAQIAGAPQLATRERALMLEIFALEGRIYDASDRVVLLLEAASNDAAAGVSSEDLNRRYTPQLAQIEVEIMQISHRQVELYAELTEAGREL